MSEGDEHFLARWSRRKREAKQAPVEAPAAPAPAPAPGDELTHPAVAPRAMPIEAPPGDSRPTQPQPLPPLESLTPESDFAPFMQAEVDPGVRRQALKTLFQDPQFNVMDGLDVYIDDYSKPDPLPEGWLAKMNQVARLGAYVDPLAEAEEDASEALAGTAQAPLAQTPQAPLAESPQAPLAQPPPLAEAPAAEAGAESPEAPREMVAEAGVQPEPIRKTTDGS